MCTVLSGCYSVHLRHIVYISLCFFILKRVVHNGKYAVIHFPCLLQAGQTCELKLVVEVAVVLYPYSPQEIAVKILIHFL